MRKLTVCLFFVLNAALALTAQTPGELSVSVTTSSTGGNYAPKNILAIWISKEDGQFVKTLLAYADKRITHLNTWQASTASAGSEYNRVDAITGATQAGHATRTCSWNGTDLAGAIVPDGKYLLHMELTDKNSTGNIASFTFTKSDSAELTTPANKPSFSSISLNWVSSSSVNIGNNFDMSDYQIFPNPGSGIYHVHGSNIKGLEIRSITGELIHHKNTLDIDISNYENGIYLIYIITDEVTIIRKIIKNDSYK